MLRVSRRNVLASTAAVAAITTNAGCAEALLQRRPGAVGISHITLVNASPTTLKAGSVTQLIGCPFKRGDIPKGTWPQFQLKSGANVPCTILNELAVSWNDGSLKFVPVMLSIPKSIPGNATTNIFILPGGQMPLPSPRRLSDFHQGIDPQVQVDGLDNLSGTWIMELKHAIRARTKVVCYGNGAAGAVWKVRANARQGGADHGQLVCDFYVASLANPDGSLKGLRVLGKVKLPYYDTNAPMNWMSFSRFQLCLDRGGALIRDCFGSNFGSGRAYTFSWAGGSTFNADSGYSTANNGDYAYCTRLTTTGTLPAGLSPNTSYFTANPTATQISFSTCSFGGSYYWVSATDGGSGTQTATPYPYLAYFGALFTAGPTGMWDFVQGAGSDSTDTTLRFQMNRSYWVSTGLIPSYDVKIVADNNVSTSYWPNCSEPITRSLETTGDRDDLGPLPAWYVRHFLTQSAIDEQVVRVASLIGGHGFSIGLEDSATLSYPAVNNGQDGAETPYRGMPPPNCTFRWAPGISATSGFTDTTNPLVQLAGFSQQDTSHMPQLNYYPYLLTGEPWHLDMLLEHANNAVYGRWSFAGTANIDKSFYALGDKNNGGGCRVLTVGSNATRYGITIGCCEEEERTDAWASMLLVAASAVCPDRNPDCPSYQRYFNDMNKATWNAAVDILHALPPFAASCGLWDVNPNWGANTFSMQHWQMGFLGSAVALAVAATENVHALVALKATVSYYNHIFTSFGGWHVGGYETVARMGDQYGSPLAKDDNHFAFWGPTITWTMGGQFTFGPFSNYKPANGDKYMFTDSGVLPAGFKNFKPYYMVELNGTTFGLSATNGGAAIALTDSNANGTQMYIVSIKPPGVGSMTDIGSPASYNSEILGMLSYADAAGATVPSDLIGDLAHRNRHAGTNYASNPKWAMTTTFLPNDG